MLMFNSGVNETFEYLPFEYRQFSIKDDLEETVVCLRVSIASCGNTDLDVPLHR